MLANGAVGVMVVTAQSTHRGLGLSRCACLWGCWGGGFGPTHMGAGPTSSVLARGALVILASNKQWAGPTSAC